MYKFANKVQVVNLHFSSKVFVTFIASFISVLTLLYESIKFCKSTKHSGFINAKCNFSVVLGSFYCIFFSLNGALGECKRENTFELFEIHI